MLRRGRVAAGIIGTIIIAVGVTTISSPDSRHLKPRPTPTPIVSRAPSPTPITTPIVLPSPTPLPTPTPSPTPTATASPTATPTPNPTPLSGWASKPVFLSYPSSPALDYEGGNGITIEITGHSFRNTAWPQSAIRIAYCTNCTVLIHDNDFDQLAWDGIDFVSVTGTVHIEYNRLGTLLRTPEQGNGRRPDAIQFAHSIMAGTIKNNKVKTGGQNEDIFSFVDDSGGPNSTNLLDVSYNAIEGGLATDAIPSTSGSGTMLSDNSTTGGHINYHHNTLLNTAQVGLGISMGIDDHVTYNIIYGAQRSGSNVGIYTPYTAGAPNPGNHEVAYNRVLWLNASGQPNSYWNGGASGTITGESTNVWNDMTINPADLQVTP